MPEVETQTEDTPTAEGEDNSPSVEPTAEPTPKPTEEKSAPESEKDSAEAMKAKGQEFSKACAGGKSPGDEVVNKFKKELEAFFAAANKKKKGAAPPVVNAVAVSTVASQPEPQGRPQWISQPQPQPTPSPQSMVVTSPNADKKNGADKDGYYSELKDGKTLEDIENAYYAYIKDLGLTPEAAEKLGYSCTRSDDGNTLTITMPSMEAMQHMNQTFFDKGLITSPEPKLDAGAEKKNASTPSAAEEPTPKPTSSAKEEDQSDSVVPTVADGVKAATKAVSSQTDFVPPTPADCFQQP